MRTSQWFLSLFAALFAVMTLCGTAALAQDYQHAPVPDGPVGDRIRALVETVNANDSDRVRKFVEEAFTPEFRDIAPMEAHLSVFADVFRRSRGYDLHGIRVYDGEAPAEGVVVILRNRLTEAWEAADVLVEEEAPYRIAGVQVGIPARPPANAPGTEEKDLSDLEIAKALDAFVERLVMNDAFSGTVILAKGDKVLYEAAHGLASKRFDVPIKIDTKFNLGSMNKMFTGVAVLQLAERGKLKLDDPISKYVDEEWLPKEITDKVRVEHLLTHTSGLGSYFNQQYMESSKLRFREVDDYKPLVNGEELAFEPGTGWRYSNTGMLLLGVVVAKASGQDYFDYMREHVYKVAGMKNTDCYDMDRPVPNLAIGYTQDEEGWVNNYYLHVVRGGPAGGGFSTAEDLLRFDRALRGHRLLGAEWTEKLWAGRPDLGSAEYGYGFGIGGTPEDPVVGHGGGFAGISSNLDMFMGSGYTAIVLSNYDSGAIPINQKIRRLIAARAK